MGLFAVFLCFKLKKIVLHLKQTNVNTLEYIYCYSAEIERKCKEDLKREIVILTI